MPRVEPGNNLTSPSWPTWQYSGPSSRSTSPGTGRRSDSMALADPQTADTGQEKPARLFFFASTVLLWPPRGKRREREKMADAMPFWPVPVADRSAASVLAPPLPKGSARGQLCV